MFCEKIKAMLALLSVTSAAFARFAGCDKSYISRITGGTRVPKNGGKGAWRIVDGLYRCADENGKVDALCAAINCPDQHTAAGVKAGLMAWLYEGEKNAASRPAPPKSKAPYRAFGEKLGALMELTGLSNIRLGRLLSLDPSYISRFRGGFRSPTANSQMTNDLCAIILSRAADRDAMPAMAKLLGVAPAELEDREIAFDMLYRWLYNAERADSAPFVEGLIDQIGSFSADIIKPPLSFEQAAAKEILAETDAAYYGNAGLQRAVIRFLGNVIQRREKELFLYSDQNMDWMVSDPVFRARWATLMTCCVTGGVKINIIHNVNRGLPEMAAAIKSWLPLYPSGMIRSYYCKTQTGTRFSTTLFLCPGYACISGVNVVGAEAEAGMYRFDTEPAQLQAHMASYRALLANAGDLIRIYQTRDIYSINNRNVTSLAGFGRTLSLATMPDETFAAALKRGRFDPATKAFLVSARRERKEQLRRSLTQGFLHEYMPVPAPEALASGALPTCALAYTPRAYAEHVRSVVELMEANPNYRLVLLPEAPFDDLDILISRDLVAVGRLTEPYLTIVFEHPDLCRAFVAYAERIREQYDQDKLTTKNRLEQFL